MGVATSKRAVIYCRVSSALQKDGSSLDVQEAACRQYVAEHGYEVVAVYKEVHTAEDYYERPQMTLVREAARQGEFDILLAFNLDRLTRSQAHIFIIDDELARLGVSLQFVTENFENTSVGRFIRNAKAFAAEVELEKIKARSYSGKIARAKNGRLMASSSPLFGYNWADAKKTCYTVNPENAAIVRRIYADYLDGKTLREVARDLTAEGIPTPRQADAWDFVSVRRLLSERQYIGEATAFREKSWKENNKKRRKRLPPEEWIMLPEGTVPPIIDRASFEDVQKRLKQNRERSIRNNQTPEAFLLRGGFVRCGYCDGPMAVNRSPRQTIYQCNKARRTHPTCSAHSISTGLLDETVWRYVESVLTDPTVIERELSRMMQSDPSAADLATIDRALSSISREQANLARAVAKMDEADAEPLVAELAQLAKRKRQSEADRQSVLGRREAWEEAQKRLSDVQEWCRTVAGRLLDLTYEQQRLALDALGVSVHVFKTDHDPRYSITASIPMDSPTVLRPTAGTQQNRTIVLRWTDHDTPAGLVTMR